MMKHTLSLQPITMPTLMESNDATEIVLPNSTVKGNILNAKIHIPQDKMMEVFYGKSFF
jgi:hypothetical protein